jgi:hypothetical protein
MKPVKLITQALTGSLILAIVLCWWDYSQQAQKYRQLLLESQQLLSRVQQIRTTGQNRTSYGCAQRLELQQAFDNLSARNNPPRNLITATLLKAKVNIYERIMDKILAELQRISAACAQS